MTDNCKTNDVQRAPSICEQLDALVGAIHARTTGKGQVTRVSFGSGASRSDVSYSDVSLTELRLSLKNLVMSSAAKSCPCYCEAAAMAGLPQRMGAISLNPPCATAGSCC